jgi:hypothetical protein
VAGFSLHAGVAARADERKKLDRLRRHISRPAVSEKRLSLKVRNDLPPKNWTTHNQKIRPFIVRDWAEE